MAINYVKFQRGSLAAYEALKSADRLDENTLYFIYSDENEEIGSLYLGSRLIGGGGIATGAMSLADLTDTIVTGADTNYFLVRNSDGKWVATSPEEVANLILNNSNSTAQVFQTMLVEGQTHLEAIEEEVSGLVIKSGDIVIVKDEFSDNKIEHTAYIYDGEAWVAMDGNYNASNVYFDDDFIFTKAIGTVSIPASGNIKVEANGKSLKEFFSALFAEEQNPLKTNPSIKELTFNKSGNYEVGTVLEGLRYSAEFEDGNYSYGPNPTGVQILSWNVEDSDGSLVGTSQEGNVAEYIVKEDSDYKIIATVSYSSGEKGLTNLGNESSVQIAAGSASKTSEAIKGYRNSFYGTFTNKNELTADLIRGLTPSGETLAEGASFDIEIPADAIRVVVAYPANLRDIAGIYDMNASRFQIKDSFIQNIISIPGLNNRDAIDYKVYISDFAEPIEEGRENVYSVVI